MSLKHGDLKDVIIPLIGVDKFRPKAGEDEDVIVVSFYTKMRSAAKDLERFLEMSVAETLDTEASDNPDPDNHYLVFVEFERNKSFWLNLRNIVKDIEAAHGSSLNWMVDVYKHEDLFRLTDPKLVDAVITSPIKYKHIHNNDTSDIKTDDYNEELDEIYHNEYYMFEAYKGSPDLLIELFDIDNYAVDLKTSYEQKLIEKYTGLPTLKVNNLYIHERSDEMVIFKLADN